MSVTTPTAPTAPRVDPDPPARDRPPEPAANAPPPLEPSRPGFWETVRAYVANEEPRPATGQVVRASDEPPTDGPPPSVRETLRAYAANREPLAGR